MKLASGWLLLFSLFFKCSYAWHSESFYEDLKIKPLADGRVSTTFSFDTVLEGASPRDPRLLSSQDTCVFTLCIKYFMK
jgi:phosphatidylinositol glycan class T